MKVGWWLILVWCVCVVLVSCCWIVIVVGFGWCVYSFFWLVVGLVLVC